MRIRPLIYAGVLLLILAVGAYLWALAVAPSWIARTLEEQLGRRISVESVVVRLPLRCDISNLVVYRRPPEEATPDFSVAQLRVAPSLASLLTGRVVLQEVALSRPWIRVERYADGTFNWSDLMRTSERSAGASAAAETSADVTADTAAGTPSEPSGGGSDGGRDAGQTVVAALRLQLEQGGVEWIDRAVGADPVSYTMRDATLAVHMTPRGFLSGRFDVVMDADVILGESAARFSARGWFEYPRNNMDAQVRLGEVEIQAIAPYLGKALAGAVTDGMLETNIVAAAENNQMRATCQLLGRGLALAQSESQRDTVATSILYGLVSQNGEMAVELEVAGKLSEPETWQVSLGGDWMRRTVQRVMKSGLETILQQAGQKMSEQAVSAAAPARIPAPAPVPPIVPATVSPLPPGAVIELSPVPAVEATPEPVAEVIEPVPAPAQGTEVSEILPSLPDMVYELVPEALAPLLETEAAPVAAPAAPAPEADAPAPADEAPQPAASGQNSP